jgi:site-specific DNA-methyltransferase (adenine-specific)/site-specific DNA-methyltransferase (cytosine-N4-specific)
MMQPYYQHGGITLYHGDCLDVLPHLAPASLDAVVTSPPYAEQRGDQYPSIPEADYPAWTVAWLNALRPALKPTGSVLINIREHIADGEMSDYVLRTRLACRAAGWIECDELIWIKPTAPPVGHPGRPRRSWERVLWFAPTRQPWCDPKANGRYSTRLGMNPSASRRAAGQWVSGTTEREYAGMARCPDYVEIPIGEATSPVGLRHPAAYPVPLAAWMIRLVTPRGGLVCDPFAGGGATLRAAKNMRYRAVGIEKDSQYCPVAVWHLQQDVLPLEDIA